MGRGDTCAGTLDPAIGIVVRSPGRCVVAAVIAALDRVLLGACALILLAYTSAGRWQAGDSAFRAVHDELTGLPNRSLLSDRLSAALHPTALRPASLHAAAR